MPDEVAKPANPDGFNEARKTQFLLALTETGTIRGAAARAGIHFSTVYNHVRDDEDFRAAIDAARGEWEQSLVAAIAKAGVQGDVIERRGSKVIKPGDWHALAWLLEHSPATREAYAGILRQKVEVGGSPDLPPVQTEHTEVQQIEVGPETMERLGKVVQILIKAGKIRLPDPGEVIDGDASDV
jgi:AcrR family transcriptional regulator